MIKNFTMRDKFNAIKDQYRTPFTPQPILEAIDHLYWDAQLKVINEIDDDDHHYDLWLRFSNPSTNEMWTIEIISLESTLKTFQLILVDTKSDTSISKAQVIRRTTVNYATDMYLILRQMSQQCQIRLNDKDVNQQWYHQQKALDDTNKVSH